MSRTSLGLRAFHSQLLCEQVVGRGLRRMDYTPDPETGLLTAEYVDIFGVPFSLIPFKGREPGEATAGGPAEARSHGAAGTKGVRDSVSGRRGLRRFVETKSGEVRRSKVERTKLDPWSTPTAAFVRPQVGYQIGHPSAHGGFGFDLVDRQAYYDSVHPQTIEFEIAREIVRVLTEAAHPGKEQLRPRGSKRAVPSSAQNRPALRSRDESTSTGCIRPKSVCKLMRSGSLDCSSRRSTPDDAQGEAPLLPRLNRYKPIGSTGGVRFKTVKPVQTTEASHLNFVACDTNSWEQAAVFQLEKLAGRWRSLLCKE